MKNLSIRLRLLIVLGVLSTSLAVMAIAGWASLSSNQARFASVYHDRVVPLGQLKTISDLYAVNIVDTVHKVNAGTLKAAEGLANIETAQSEIRKNWQSYTSTFLTDDEKRLVGAAQKEMDSANVAANKIASLIRGNDAEGLKTFGAKELYPSIDPVTAKIADLVNLQIVEADKGYMAAEDSYHSILMIFAALVLAALIAVGFAGRTIIVGVSRPLNQMTSAMMRLANRDWTTVVTSLERKDEIGEMAKALEIFKDNGVAQDDMLAKQKVEQEAKERRTKAMDAAVAEFEATVGTIVNGVSSAATEMQATAQAMSATAEETNAQATTVAAASEQASNNVQTVATAGEELSSSISEISRQVSEAGSITRRAVEQAERTSVQIV
ncbi:MAG TPA: MCP four helix bundle domain-containing protein, partial [Alphaproteobacteria bacterium]